MPATVAISAAIAAGSTAAVSWATGAAITAKALLAAAATQAIAAGIAYISRPKVNPNLGGLDAAGFSQTVRAAVAPARWVLGRARIGGHLAFAGVEDGDDRTLWLVFALAKGPLDAIERIWLGEEELEFDRTAAGVITPQASSKYAGHLTVWEILEGDGDTAGPGPTALRAAVGEEWDSEFEGNGIGYAIAKLTQGGGEDRLYTGVPNFNFQIRGLKITWPGQATATWTENAAALRYWILRERRGLPAAAFDEPSVISAIATCGAAVQVSRPSNDYANWPATEIRYAINGVIFSGDAIENIESEADFAWQGFAVERDGIYHFRPGEDRNSKAHITTRDIIAAGALIPFQPIQERLNAATMRLTQSARHDFLAYQVPEVNDSVAETRDGERLLKDLGQRLFINSPSAADRLLRIALRRARATFKATYTLSPRNDLRWLDLMPTDIITLSDPAFGLENWRAEIISTTLRDDFSVEVVLNSAPDQIYIDEPGLGQLERPYIKAPRENTPPAAVTGATLAVEPFSPTDGTIRWRATVTAPASAHGLACRLQCGGFDQTKRTPGSTLEFDFAAPAQTATATVWRENAAGIAGGEQTLAAAPSYATLSLPPATRRGWNALPGILTVELADPQSRYIKGAEFRYRSGPESGTDDLAAITAEQWLEAPRLDALPLILAPGRSALFNITFPETARYRIAARYIDSVGRLGPVADLGTIILALPTANTITDSAAPAWSGENNFLATQPHGAEILMLPDRDAIKSLNLDNWNGYVDSRRPDKYRRRHKAAGGSYGSRTDISASAASVTVSGLTNGTAYTFEIDRVEDGTAGGAATVTSTPQAAATAPPKPTLTATAEAQTVTLSGAVANNGGAAVTGWAYRIATSASALASETWTAISGASGLSASVAVSGLSASTTYHAQIRASNSVGNSAASATATATTAAAATAPPKPTLTLTAAQAGATLTLAATVTGNGGSPITAWEYRIATSISALASATWTAIAGAAGNSAALTTGALNTSTTYYVEARAKNAIGYSPASDRQSATTSAGASPFSSGTGSASDPYIIAAVADFATEQNILPDLQSRGDNTFSLSTVNPANTYYYLRARIRFTLAASKKVTVSGRILGGEYYIHWSIYLIKNQNEYQDHERYKNSIAFRRPTATLPAGTHEIWIRAPALAAVAQLSTLTLQITLADPEGGGSADPGLPGPERVETRAVGSTGARLTWAAPTATVEGYGLTGFEVEYQAAAGGAWAAWPAGLGPAATVLTAPSGVSGESAWRIRAIYLGGPTGSAASGWKTVSISDLGEASGAASTSPLTLEATAGDGQVTLAWTDPNLRPGSFWPWGECEGYGADFAAATSTYYQTPIIDLGETASAKVSVKAEHFEPFLNADGAAETGGASPAADSAPLAGPVFEGDIGHQIWTTGAAITALDAPPASAGGQTIAYSADGLPRGLSIDGNRRISGTPTLAAGSAGIARIAARTPDGLEDHIYFAWRLAAAPTLPLGGAGTLASGYALGSTAATLDIRDLLKNGASNAADLEAAADGSATQAIPTYFEATAPAGEIWAFDLWDPEGGADSEDFDIIDYPAGGSEAFRATTGGRERRVIDNSAGASALTHRIGVYAYAATSNTTQVNANAEGEPAKPSLRIAWAPLPEDGQALADGWAGYATARAGTFAPGSESGSEIYLRHGTAKGSLTEVGPVTGERTFTARYIQAKIHLKRWRGRALRQLTTTIRKG